MIAIDTNVLLRYLLQDDPAQSKKVDALFSKHTQILITDIVLAETLWTLKGKKYQLSREQIIKIIEALIQDTFIVFESADAVWCAFNDFLKAKTSDFPDTLIVNKAIQYGKTTGARIQAVYTFNKGALEIAGTKEP